MKIIVTGYAGFIGSNLTKALLKKGHKVYGFDNFSFGNHDNIQDFINHDNFVAHDMDIIDINHSFIHGVDMIVHLASSKIPRFGKTLQCMQNNIMGYHRLMESSFDIPVIFASTSDVYGKQTDIPFNEKQDLTYGSPEHRRWVYGLSKLIDENFTIGFHEEFNKPYNIVRFFNVYGENCALDWTGGIVPQVIGKMLTGEDVEIHGDGKQTRCFTHVSDIVSGLIKLIEGDVWSETFNMGNNKIVDMNELVDVIYNIIQPKESKIKYIPYKEFFGKYEDVRVRQPDISKIKEMTGWEPKVDLIDGLKRTIEWQKGVMK
jgi:UDP-glucose 4-epimerase